MRANYLIKQFRNSIDDILVKHVNVKLKTSNLGRMCHLPSHVSATSWLTME